MALLCGMFTFRLLRLERAFVGALVLLRHCNGRAEKIEKSELASGAHAAIAGISRLKSSLNGRFRSLMISLRLNDQQFGRKDAGDGRIFCTVPFEKLVINCDGRVHCGSSVESPVVGDTRNQTLSEIWNGKALRDIRSEIIQGRPTHCGKCRIHGLAKDYHVKETPKVVMEELPSTYWIEPISVCNFDCPVPCGNKSPASISPMGGREKKMMKLEDFRRIAGMMGGNTKRIGLFNYGEPLLHPHIVEMIKHARTLHPKAFLFANSNGSRLADPELRKGLMASGLDELHLSIDGCDQESYGTYRRGGDFRKIMESIAEMTASEGPRPLIQWQYILFFWNDSEAQRAKALQAAIDCRVDRFVFQTSSIALTNSKTFLEGSRSFKEIAPFLIDTRRFKYAHETTLLSDAEKLLVLRVRNLGDIRWNSREKPWGRYVRLVAYTLSDGTERVPIHVQKLETDVEPGECADFRIPRETLSREAPQTRLYFDLQLFNEFYFGERGSLALSYLMRA